MRISEAEFIELLTEVLGERAEAEYNKLPSDEELAGTITFSPNFERRMKKLFRNPKAYIKNYHRPMYMKALRMAASVLLVISLLFGTLMAIPQARAIIIRIIQTWFEDHTTYTFTEPEPGTVVGGWTISYMTEGYSLIQKHESGTDTVCLYSNQKGDILLIEIFGSNISLNIDNENYTYADTTINGIKTDVYKSVVSNFHDCLVMNYEAENIIIKISGIAGIDELKTIAESITMN